MLVARAPLKTTPPLLVPICTPLVPDTVTLPLLDPKFGASKLRLPLVTRTVPEAVSVVFAPMLTVELALGPELLIVRLEPDKLVVVGNPEPALSPIEMLEAPVILSPVLAESTLPLSMSITPFVLCPVLLIATVLVVEVTDVPSKVIVLDVLMAAAPATASTITPVSLIAPEAVNVIPELLDRTLLPELIVSDPPDVIETEPVPVTAGGPA
jgi:hypothetical protein